MTTPEKQREKSPPDVIPQSSSAGPETRLVEEGEIKERPSVETAATDNRQPAVDAVSVTPVSANARGPSPSPVTVGLPTGNGGTAAGNNAAADTKQRPPTPTTEPGTNLLNRPLNTTQSAYSPASLAGMKPSYGPSPSTMTSTTTSYSTKSPTSSGTTTTPSTKTTISGTGTSTPSAFAKVTGAGAATAKQPPAPTFSSLATAKDKQSTVRPHEPHSAPTPSSTLGSPASGTSSKGTATAKPSPTPPTPSTKSSSHEPEGDAKKEMSSPPAPAPSSSPSTSEKGLSDRPAPSPRPSIPFSQGSAAQMNDAVHAAMAKLASSSSTGRSSQPVSVTAAFVPLTRVSFTTRITTEDYDDRDNDRYSKARGRAQSPPSSTFSYGDQRRRGPIIEEVDDIDGDREAELYTSSRTGRGGGASASTTRAPHPPEPTRDERQASYSRDQSPVSSERPSPSSPAPTPSSSSSQHHQGRRDDRYDARDELPDRERAPSPPPTLLFSPGLFGAIEEHNDYLEMLDEIRAEEASKSRRNGDNRHYRGGHDDDDDYGYSNRDFETVAAAVERGKRSAESIASALAQVFSASTATDARSPPRTSSSLSPEIATSNRGEYSDDHPSRDKPPRHDQDDGAQRSATTPVPQSSYSSSDRSRAHPSYVTSTSFVDNLDGFQDRRDHPDRGGHYHHQSSSQSRGHYSSDATPSSSNDVRDQYNRCGEPIYDDRGVPPPATEASPESDPNRELTAEEIEAREIDMALDNLDDERRSILNRYIADATRWTKIAVELLSLATSMSERKSAFHSSEIENIRRIAASAEDRAAKAMAIFKEASALFLLSYVRDNVFDRHRSIIEDLSLMEYFSEVNANLEDKKQSTLAGETVIDE